MWAVGGSDDAYEPADVTAAAAAAAWWWWW